MEEERKITNKTIEGNINKGRSIRKETEVNRKEMF